MTNTTARQAGLTDEQIEAAFDAERKDDGDVTVCQPKNYLIAHDYFKAGVLAAHSADARNGEGVAPAPYIVGNQYRTQAGDLARFVKVHNEGTSYETMEDESGVNRYTRRDFGRCTGSAHDYSDSRNTPPLYLAAPTPKRTLRAQMAESSPLVQAHRSEDGNYSAPAAQADRNAAQLCDWLLTDPQSGERLRFAGPLENDFMRLSRVRMESESGSIWTLTAKLEEGYLTASQRMANIKAAALNEGQQSAAPAAPAIDTGTIDRLTREKTVHIMARDGFAVSGFVLSKAPDSVCVVDHSAVRWLTGDELFRVMHPDSTPADAASEADKVDTTSIIQKHLEKYDAMREYSNVACAQYNAVRAVADEIQRERQQGAQSNG